MRHEWTVFPNGPDGHAHLLFVTTLEKTGEPTSNATPAEAFAECLGLAERIAALEAREAGIRQTLRIECEELGDNDWPNDLHLGNVIEKHLCRPAMYRIRELEGKNAGCVRAIDRLEERERKLREGLRRLVAAASGDDWEVAQAAIEHARALLKEE